MRETPSSLGFNMPGEWEPHSALWLAWPHDEITFPDGRVKKVEKVFCQMISAVHRSEPVELLVLDEAMKTRVESLLKATDVDLSKINFHLTDYADVWIRDYGPTFLKNPTTRDIAWVKWQYNAYGHRFPDLLKDNEVFFNLRKAVDKRMFEPGILSEGGAIESNGQGVILTTEECLLNPNRNPNLTKQAVEETLKDFLGVSKVIWLKKGLTGDHTDGHIDELARFVSSNQIVCAYEPDPTQANHRVLQENYQTLLEATDTQGKPFEVIKLPVPHITYDQHKPFEAGEQAPVSYTNFYVANQVVLASVFNDPLDAAALNTLKTCFPGRKIVPVDCTDVIYGGGGVHCMTQQQPAF